MSLLKSAILSAAESRSLRERAVRTRFVRRAVSRFMPGETVDDALEAARATGVGSVLTRLGENLANPEEAEEVERHYLDVLNRVKVEGLDVEISVKLTQLGLDFSREQCEENLHALAERARSYDNWLWVDMESSAYTEVTVEVYKALRAKFPNTGLCVQSYLYRTAADVEALIAIGAGVRLVKGAYLEPPDKAYQKKEDVDESFFRLAQRLLSADAREKNVRAIFGTHDPTLIGRIEEHARERRLLPGDVEFQMLYGIRRSEQLRLAAAGYRFRVLISYGEAWFPWYMRRLAERPANMLFVVRSLLAG